MQIRDQFRRELPSLRQCGRALVGEQRIADVSTLQLMEDLLSGSAFVTSAENSRVAIYRSFLAVLKRNATLDTTQPFDERFTPKTRLSHWLTVVERFSDECAAEIMDINIFQLRSLLGDYESEILQEKRATIQIIEDEALIAHDLKRIVSALHHEVLAVSSTRTAALEAFHRRSPDLILSDVQLADGSSGIDAIDEIRLFSMVPAIFITAYPERLLTGAREEPAFLIAKPFDPKVVKATIRQALHLRAKQN